MSLQGKTALVTGASRGIGKAIALALAEHGAYVFGTATTEEGADFITTYLKEAGLSGKGLMLNINEKEGIDRVVSEIKSSIGAVDILVNNAAITKDNLFIRMKDDEWNDVINTNLNAHMTPPSGVKRDRRL